LAEAAAWIRDGHPITELRDLEVKHELKRHEFLLRDLRDAIASATSEQAEEWVKLFDWMQSDMSAGLRAALAN